MPPSIAAVAYTFLILLLFYLDRSRQDRPSLALWIPTIWLLLACSRSVGQWLTLNPIDTADQVLEGSPLDRLVYAGLVALGLIVLINRGRPVVRFLHANAGIVFFFLFCAVSLLWSDFPGVAFKRWTKALGDLVMVLIVVTDPQRVTAIKQLLARLAYVLIPLSFLFIKYYPGLGMGYNEWTGQPVYLGVTTNKNTLGAISLGLGLAALWRFASAYKGQEGAGRVQKMVANAIIFVMVLRLFLLINSMTSLSCFVMASILLLATNSRTPMRRPVVVHFLMASMILVSASVLFLGASPDALHAIGRNPTLTERTYLWDDLLHQVRNPIFGTGFESFWLGPRLKEIWILNPWRPNEAHDGYLEIFLNLGWLGVGLLAVVIAAGYRNVFRSWRTGDSAGSLRLAYFLVGMVFNFTEAAFFRMMAPVWLFFLFAITNVPEAEEQKTEKASHPVPFAQPLRTAVAPQVWR